MSFFGHKQTSERRQSARVADSFEVHYQVPNEPMRLECASRDISEEGMRFGLYQRLEVGAVLKFALYLRGLAGPTWLFGHIAWTRETSAQKHLYEAGVRFIGLDAGLRSKLQGYLRGLPA